MTTQTMPAQRQRGPLGAARAAVWAAALSAAAALAGCASTSPAGTGPTPERPSAVQKKDPWEPFNRDVMAFNDALDKAIIMPVATAYRDVVPPLVRTGVDNFFGNFDDAWSALNQLLQAKPERSLHMGTRFLVNSFIGLGGILDPATDMGLDRAPEDFGQTLGVWGFGPGPYLVLPIFGPSTGRDAIALPLDRAASPEIYLLQGEAGRWALTGLHLVSVRSNLLGASRLLDEIALDRYSFLRDAYLARRLNQVYDGNPPEVPEEAEPSASEMDPSRDEVLQPGAAASAPR